MSSQTHYSFSRTTSACLHDIKQGAWEAGGGDDTGWGQDTTLCGAWETSLYMFQEINAFFASVKQKCLLNKSQKWKYLQFDCNMCI